MYLFLRFCLAVELGSRSQIPIFLFIVVGLQLMILGFLGEFIIRIYRKQNNIPFEILEAVNSVNEKQKKSLLPKIQKLMPNLKDKKIAVWGLAFKPKTDDMREAPSIVIIEELQKLGAKIIAFDPEAEKTAKKILKDVEYSKTPYDALKDADALVVVTEWNEFRDETLYYGKIVFDGRRVLEPKKAATFCDYQGICW